jgi:hypothetical protein
MVGTWEGLGDQRFAPSHLLDCSFYVVGSSIFQKKERRAKSGKKSLEGYKQFIILTKTWCSLLPPDALRSSIIRAHYHPWEIIIWLRLFDWSPILHYKLQLHPCGLNLPEELFFSELSQFLLLDIEDSSMSSSDPQGIESDLLIFNTDEVNPSSNTLSDAPLDHHKMSLDEFGHWDPERELLHSERSEDDFCAILNTTKRKVSPEVMGEEQQNRLKPSCSTEKQEDDAVDGLLADLQRSHTPTRVPSQASSDASSLEPLSEAFEVPTPLSPPATTRNLPSQRDSRRHSHTFYKPVLEGDFSQRMRPNYQMPTPSNQTRSHKRAKSETPSTLNSPTEERKHWSTYEDGFPGNFSHFHLEGPCQSHLPVSVPPSPRCAPISLSSPLIADVNVAKSRSVKCSDPPLHLMQSSTRYINLVEPWNVRVLVTKTHCFYPEKSTLIPFSSCLLGEV